MVWFRLLAFGCSFLFLPGCVTTRPEPAPPGAAQGCANGICGYDACHTPAYGAPSSLWGDLQPTDRGMLPSSRDNTAFNQFGFFGCKFPYFESLDAENGWLFVVTNRGFQIWDASTPATVKQPQRKAHMCNDIAHNHPVPVFPTSGENSRFTFNDVDAPTGRDDLAATVLRNDSGLVIWDTANKSAPRVLYQDHGSNGAQVYAATIGARSYAFSANEQHGLLVYDLDQARTLATTPCLEKASQEVNAACAGVFLGRLGAATNAGFVDGYDDAANGEHFVVFAGSRGAGKPTLEIWNVKKPRDPRLRMSENGLFNGVALWKDASDGDYYLAVRTLSDSRIYRDAGDCLPKTGASCRLADFQQVWSAPISAGGRKFVTYSESGGIPFLYFGGVDLCTTPETRERLFQVSDPANPQEIGSPEYWDYYYRTHHTTLDEPGDRRAGFNFVAPRVAKFSGSFLYRAGWSIFDVHRWTKATQCPALEIRGPRQGFFGEELAFEANAKNCTPRNRYGWSASGGGTVAGNKARVRISWPAAAGAGLKTLEITNAGCGATADCPAAIGRATVDVQSPAPRVDGIRVEPATPAAGETVILSAEGAGGRPPLTFRWTVRDAGNQVVASGSGEGLDTFQWKTSFDTSPGTYRASVRVTSAADPASARADATFELTRKTLEIVRFQADCPFGLCTFQVGERVRFLTQVSGEPDRFQYDWDGDGSFEETSPTEVSSHVYRAAVTGVRPRLRVRRGTQQTTFTHTRPLTVEAALEIEGPATLEAGQAGTFRASATGCETAPNRWRWSADGGGAIDAPTRRQVNVTWAEKGRKTLRARHEACGDVEATFEVVVTERDVPEPVLPKPPSDLRATVRASREVQLDWRDNSDNEAGFRIERRSDGEFVTAGTVGAGVTALLVTDLEPATSYRFRVRAFNDTGDSAPSNVVRLTTFAECPPDTLCIDDDPRDLRFQVRLRFKTVLGGGLEGDGGATALSSLGITKGGIFYFTDPANPEILIKVLDGCGINDRYWVFAAATTTVGFDLNVRDTRTGKEKVYTNPDRTAAATITDTDAFDTCVPDPVAAPLPPPADPFASTPVRVLGAAAGCSPTALCIDDQLGDGRFRVSLHYKTVLGGGLEGDARAISLAPLGITKGGILSFTDPANPEVLVKVLNGCGINGHFWVFSAATTTVGFELRVEDTKTGETRRYTNPDRQAATTVTDTQAFATCAP